MKPFVRIVFLVMGLWAYQVDLNATDYLLYDAGLGTAPEQQDWLFYGSDPNGTATQTSNGTSGIRLTTDLAARAGWSNTIPQNTLKNAAFPALSSTVGFAIDWSMRVISESHSSDDRAGTSVTLLSSGNKGIELGFWGDKIWAQKADLPFTRGESANYITTSAVVNYRLLIKDSRYHLFANNAEILTGQTRSYAAFGSAPYTLSNYFFIGDNTTSASATVDIGSIRLITNVPETRAAGLIITTAAIIIGCAQRRRVLVRHIS